MSPSTADGSLTVCYSTITGCAKRLTPSHDDLLFPTTINTSSGVGWEYAGYSVDGKRVMGLCNGNGTNHFLSTTSILFQLDVPDYFSLPSAVTIPLPYTIAYYCLYILTSIKSSDKIFISGSWDGIDIALISLCLSVDCKVLIHLGPMVPTIDYYRKLFPSLNESNFITNGNPTDLDKLLLQSTDTLGVNLVINMNLKNDLCLLLNCLSFGGKLINIGSIIKEHINTHDLNDLLVTKCVSFESFEPFDLLRRLSNENCVIKKKLVDLFNQGLAERRIKSIPFVAVNRDDDCDQQFKLANGKKLVIVIRPDKTDEPVPVKCIARTFFDSNKCYILIGGLGGIGLQLTRWMVRRGAKSIVITSRSGIKTQYQRFIIERSKSLNRDKDVKISIVETPTIDYESCETIVKKSIEKYGPIGGVFNLAGVLKSGLLEMQDVTSFNEVCHPKVEVSEYFDRATRLHCPQLDYFVCFSSISALGILGEPSYGYANSYMERLCEDRRSSGLPGLAIQWGAIKDVGMVRNLTTSVAGSDFRGVLGLINDLDKFLQLPYPVCYSIQHATKQEPLTSGKGNILQRIGHILGCQSLDKMDGSTTLGDLGLGSLQAIEVKTLIDTTCNISMSNIAILKLSISQLDSMATEALNQMNRSTDSENTSIEEPVLINLTNKGTDPIFFFPPAFFDFLSMILVAQALNRTVVGVQLTERVRSLGTFHAISQFYAETILSAYPNLSKYDFVGYSFGCTVSFELAKVLQKMIGKSRIDRIVFIDASPYGLKKLGQKTTRMVLAGYPLWEIFIAFMECMGVKIDDKTRQSLKDSEDDESMHKEIISQIMVDSGMNGPTDSLVDNAVGLIDRAYYLGSINDLGSFDGDALFIQVINKAVSSSGTSSLVNEGLSKIIKGSLKTVMFNATHFDILKVYAREIATEIEKIMF